MPEDLFELVERTYACGSQLPYWQPILRDLKGQVLQLEVVDGESIYVEFTGGGPLVRRGTSDDPRAEVIRAAIDTFREVFQGKRRLVDATWEGDMNARIYHGRCDLYYMISSFVKATQGITDPY